MRVGEASNFDDDTTMLGREKGKESGRVGID
jgi:hypothetical protein